MRWFHRLDRSQAVIVGRGSSPQGWRPGPVHTRLYDGAFGSHDRARDALYRDFEAVQPDDVAAVVATSLDMPPNVDLTAIEILPTKRVFGGSANALDPQ